MTLQLSCMPEAERLVWYHIVIDMRPQAAACNVLRDVSQLEAIQALKRMS